jgi:hypothetical protein
MLRLGTTRQQHGHACRDGLTLALDRTESVLFMDGTCLD